MSDNDDNNIDFQLLFTQIPSQLRNRIFNPPRAENEQDKNILHIIRQLHKLDFDDETIELILSQYPISQGKNIKELIEKSRLGNPSENSLSREFAEKLKLKLRFCKQWGKWLFWSDTHWQLDEIGESIEQIRLTLESTDMPDFRRRWITVKNIELLAQNEPDLRTLSSSWDQNSWLLATPNGTVDLKTGKLRISYPEDMMTKITKISPKIGTPNIWLKFLNEATFNNQEYISYLQRITGYCLTGSIKEQALFFLHGAGGNGKGVFLNTLTSILGDYAVVAPMGTFVENKFDNHPTETALLRGARLVTAQEVQEGKAWNEVKIKTFTGGDPITARFMREDFFTFYPNFKLLIAGNHEPQLRNVDDATKRRFNKLPFIHKPSQPDKDLMEKLVSEYPYILQWMIDGCLLWQKEGLNPPQIIIESTKEYFDNQNSFQQFLDDECVCKKDDKSFGESSVVLFQAFCSWASKNHTRQGNISMFRENLEKYGFLQTKHLPQNRDTRGFFGIKLKSSTPRQLTKFEIQELNKKRIEGN